ncbi:hypothetical protein RsTz2092_13170 [Deferribacterales bacterium RsTz2092]|nr:hypothetical protein AGMMS49941_12290 [Deferribacterales bacterium]
MSWSKRVTVAYYTIEAAEEDYFSKFYDNAETMLSTGNTANNFESGGTKYSWKLIEKVDVDKTATYFFSVVRERQSWPLWVRDEGVYNELSLSDGTLGDIAYGFLNVANRALVCFAAGAGGASTGFRKLLGQFSEDGLVRLLPYCDEEAYNKVLDWDNYKQLSFSLSMPTGSELSSFEATEVGTLTKILGYLGGLKADIKVSAGNKELLSNGVVKDIIPTLIENEMCKSLTVSGSSFENTKPERIDLKNAQIKYSETIEMDGNYVSEYLAKQVLSRAVSEQQNLIFKPK